MCILTEEIEAVSWPCCCWSNNRIFYLQFPEDTGSFGTEEQCNDFSLQKSSETGTGLNLSVPQLKLWGLPRMLLKWSNKGNFKKVYLKKVIRKKSVYPQQR